MPTFNEETYLRELKEAQNASDLFLSDYDKWKVDASKLVTIEETSKGESSYGVTIRGNVRAFWNGSIQYSQFIDTMLSSIRRGLTQAWHDGMKSCGLSSTDMTPDERASLELIITSEFMKLHGFADYIQEGLKSTGGKFGDLLSRASLWINRYTDVVNQARLLACKDGLLIWEVTAGKKHCSSCASLEGFVKRASEWLIARIWPRRPLNAKLDCGGWKCGCNLIPTNLPRTTEGFPVLP